MKGWCPMPNEVAYDLMLAALRRIRDNWQRWLDTGKPSGPEESEEIWNQTNQAIALAEVKQVE